MVRQRKPKLYDFVVLPARGLFVETGSSQEAATALAELISTRGALESFETVAALLGHAIGIDVRTSAAISYLWDRAKSKAFALEVTSNRQDGGPVAVKATAETERMLRSIGFRVLRQQTYSLIEPSDAIAVSVATGAAPVDFRSELHLHGPGRGTGPLGDGVTIGIVDTGVDGDHPALAHAVTGGRCFVAGEPGTDWRPSAGPKGWHGTHVAGLVAARDPTGRMPDGVAPAAKIRSYRVFGGAQGNAVETIGVIDAIAAAVEDGCDIVNLSLGGRGLREDGVRDAINYAWDSGAVCVAAAGNQATTVSFPAAHPNCIGVSALGRESLIPANSPDAGTIGPVRSRVDPDVFMAAFSNFGPQIDFAGPGVALVSTLPGGGYGSSSGTSMAAPVVSAAGAVALSRNDPILRSAKNRDRAAAIFALLVASARPFRLGSLDYEGYGVPL